MSVLTPNSSGNMQKHGYLWCSHAASAREYISGVWVIDQSHRYGRHQTACREPAGSYDKSIRTDICFEHKTQYLLIRAPYARTLVFWHISNIPPPPWFRRVNLIVIPPRFKKQQYLWNIAIQPAVGCYNSWASLQCSACYPLGEKLLWNRSITAGSRYILVNHHS